MFKRSRDGGPVATQLKRQCLTFTPMPTVAPTPTPSLKRKREHIDLLPVQRLKSTETSIIGRKRTAAFDDELKHLEKRMRASVPTAEEAIAFLLPHLFSLRTLYNESQHKVDELSRNNLLLQKTCTYLISEKKRLTSEVELANYRVALAGATPYGVGNTE